MLVFPRTCSKNDSSVRPQTGFFPNTWESSPGCSQGSSPGSSAGSFQEPRSCPRSSPGGSPGSSPETSPGNCPASFPGSSPGTSARSFPASSQEALQEAVRKLSELSGGSQETIWDHQQLQGLRTALNTIYWCPSAAECKSSLYLLISRSVFEGRCHQVL